MKEGYKPKRYRPPDWCKPICTAADSTACVYHCARTRQGVYFQLDKEMTIEEMPPFPMKTVIYDSSAAERLRIISSYLSKLVDERQGKETVYRNDEQGEFIAGDIDSWVQMIVESSTE